MRQTRAFYLRKTVFKVPKKPLFMRIKFFSLIRAGNNPSKVCSESDFRNFGTKFVGIKALRPVSTMNRKY